MDINRVPYYILNLKFRTFVVPGKLRLQKLRTTGDWRTGSKQWLKASEWQVIKTEYSEVDEQRLTITAENTTFEWSAYFTVSTDHDAQPSDHNIRRSPQPDTRTDTLIRRQTDRLTSLKPLNQSRHDLVTGAPGAWQNIETARHSMLGREVFSPICTFNAPTTMILSELCHNVFGTIKIERR